MYLSILEIANMLKGDIIGGGDEVLVDINKTTIDSRSVMLDSIFIAIKGDNNDGHNFVTDAIKNGAVLIIVDKNHQDYQFDVVYIRVEDTTQGLIDFATNYRMKFNIPIVGITGSNGKTTVKEMLKSICLHQYSELEVLANIGNLNNKFGVALTLLKLNQNHKVAIIEMGMNHFLEIKLLVSIAKPSIVVVTNVAQAHIGNFTSLDDIAVAKGEIYQDLAPEGIALIDKSSSYARYWANLVIDGNVVYYNDNSCSYYIKDIDVTNNTCTFIINNQSISIKLHILGKHNYYNALVVSTIASLLKCSASSIIKGIESYKAYKSRLEQKKAFNGAIIIDDSYNANPDSVKSAIMSISNLPKPHWFIFGDLKELGIFSRDKHHEIGTFAKNNGIDFLLTMGDDAIITNHSFGDNAIHFKSHMDIIKYCYNKLPDNATLLIKGSNSSKLWQIADALSYDYKYFIGE